MKTKFRLNKKMRYFLYTLLVAVFLTSCAEDELKIDGTLIKINGKYYKLDNRLGNSYIFEPIKIDSTIVIFNGN